MTKYRLLCQLLLIFNLGIVTIFEANAQTGDNANLELEAAAKQKIITNANSMIKDGKAAEAYALLQPYQSEYAGDPDYDYLLGLAALDSGRATEAIFAFERVLAVNPAHLQARAEIARAYLATGETAASEQEFQTVKQQNPPKEVSATIQKYLDIIETARSGRSTSVQGYIEATYGSDNNVNSATAPTALSALPGTYSGSLSANAVKQNDTFKSVAGGFNIRHAVSSEWAIIGGANFNQRMNSTWDIFDTSSVDGSLGTSLSKGDNSYSAVLQLQSFSIDNKRYRDSEGMTAQWQRNLSKNSQASAYVQYNYLTYPGRDIQDADRYVAGAACVLSLTGKYSPVAYFSGYGGTEKEREENVPYNGHHLYGLRVGGEMKLNAQTTLLASASAENRKYGGTHPLSSPQEVRHDKQADARVGLNYALGKQWMFISNLSYTRNDSNIIINDYTRTAFSIGLRLNFN